MERAPTRLGAKIATAVFLVNLFAILTAVAVLQQSRRQHEERAALTTQNLAELLRHDIGDHFDRLEAVVDAVAAEYAVLAARHPLQRDLLQRRIAASLARNPSLIRLWLLDANGTVLAALSSVASPEAALTVANLARLREAPEDGLQILGKEVAASADAGAILLARRLAGRDGRAEALVLASMPTGPLQPMFQALQIGEHGSLSLRDGQLRLLMRKPERPDILPGGSIKLSPGFRRTLQVDAQGGTYIGEQADDDGVVRLHSYRHHGRHGFYVNVGLAREDFLSPWWREAAALAAAAAGLLLLTLLSGWQLYRSSRQREHADRNIAGLLEENRRLLASLFAAGEDQRRKLARDLHDELGQWLAAIQVNTRVVGDFLGGVHNAELLECTRTIADSALEINHVIRDMVRLLRPPLLDTMGLKASIDDLVAHWLKYQSRTRCTLNVNGDIDHLAEAVNIAVYRILQEGLANITKHAAAAKVSIDLSLEAGGREAARTLRIVIEDDGVGMAEGAADPRRQVVGVGLLGIRERAVALGGGLEIAAAPSRGCRLTVTIPLTAKTLAKVPA